MPARRTPSSSGANAYNTPPNSQPTKNHSPPRSTRSKRGSQRNGVSDSDGGGSSSNSPKYTAYLRERSYDDLNDSNPFAREEAFLRAMSETDIWASALAPQNSIDSVPDGNDINPFITNFNGDNAIGSRDINNIGVDRRVPPSIPSITTNTTIVGQKNTLFWLLFILLAAFITLFALSIFESPIKVQLWPVNNTIYRIQPAGENEDGSSDIAKGGNGDGGGILFTMDDLKKLITAEVRRENGANAPSIGPSSDHVRDLVRSFCSLEIKRELSAQRSEPRLRGGKFNADAIMELIREEARKIVSKELLVYSQDTLNLPDFALHSGGAKVMSALTSKTYEVWPEKWYSKMFAHMSGQGILRGKPPVTAISPETHVGQCWPFPGEQGQLAILLNRRVYVNAVTYDHVSKDVAIEVMSAPRDFEVWGIVDEGTGGKGKTTANNELEEVDDGLFMESTDEECGIREDGQYISDHENQEQSSSNSKALSDSLGSSPLHFSLGSFTYDITGLPVQTFNVSPEILKSNKPIRAIIMKVKNNWGEPNYTCLYRFRVHGEPAINRVTTRDA